MSRLTGWLKGSTAKPSSCGESKLDESEYLEDAMLCATMIMNDEVEEAEIRLNVGWIFFLLSWSFKFIALLSAIVSRDLVFFSILRRPLISIPCEVLDFSEGV